MPISGRGIRRLLMLAALTAGLVAPTPAATLRARGDFLLQAETFSTPVAGGLTLLRFFLQVPASGLTWETRGDSLFARVRLEWELHALGRSHAAESEHLTLSRSRSDGEGAQSLLIARERLLPAGEYRLELSCRDEGRKIGGLAGLFGRYPEVRLSERVPVRDFRAGATLGDPLTYSYRGEDSAPRVNPGGVYGLGEPWLELRSQFVPPAGALLDEERYFTLVLGIEDEHGEKRFERRGGWKYRNEIVPLHFRLPLAGLKPGSYHLQLLLQGEGLDAAAFRRSFHVLGGGEVADDVLAQSAIEAQLFLEGEAYEIWHTMPDAERVRAIRRFWLQQDPNPDTAENEIYEEFLHRYEIAQTRFTVFQPGALSDRGRVLIRYGEPDELRVEVMPENRMALINAVRKLHGKQEIEPGISPWSPNIGDGSEGAGEDPELLRDLSRIGLGNSPSFGNESEPFEVWTYELEGKPLLARYKLSLQGVGLKLIFVDRKGYGEYELAYRSEDFDF